MSRALFDAYAVVDWSARSAPSPARPARDAIWWAVARRAPELRVERPRYHRTRAEAEAALAAFLAAERAAGRRVLVGFDFPFGYPASVAERIAGKPSALALWRWLAARIEDGPANANNRFSVARQINRRYGGLGPFWGRPASWDFPEIPTRASARHGAHPPERRRADRAVPGAKTVWQLAYAGSVGSQVLMGLPALDRLRHAPGLADIARIWPFETGLAKPAAPIVLAEIYPSLIAARVRARARPGEIADRAQVRVNALAFARLDDAGALAPLFAGPATLTAADRRAIEAEEAWILGAGFEDRLREAA